MSVNKWWSDNEPKTRSQDPLVLEATDLTNRRTKRSIVDRVKSKPRATSPYTQSTKSKTKKDRIMEDEIPKGRSTKTLYSPAKPPLKTGPGILKTIPLGNLQTASGGTTFVIPSEPNVDQPV